MWMYMGIYRYAFASITACVFKSHVGDQCADCRRDVTDLMDGVCSISNLGPDSVSCYQNPSHKAASPALKKQHLIPIL